MNMTYNTKHFCVPAVHVLFYTLTILQITNMLLRSVCNFGIQVNTSQITFYFESHLHIIFSFVFVFLNQ